MSGLKRSVGEFVIEVRCPGYDLSDAVWEITGPTYAACWQQISEQLANHTVEAFGKIYSISSDWSRVAPLVMRMHRSHERIYGAAAKKDFVTANKVRFPRTPAKVTISSEVEASAEEEVPHKIVVENWLHDVFLIANLSAPGSSDFYRIQVREIGERKRRTEDHVDLTGLYFDLSFIETNQGQWPLTQTLPVELVAKWYWANREGCSQVPKNQAEKVFFALLHIAKLDMSPLVIIWLFFALETLFDTRPGENLRVLSERISLLLAPNPKQSNFLRKQLRELYNVRSALVHGGFELFHPLMFEHFDEHVSRVHDKWMRPAEFGFRLLLASMQEVIAREIKWPCFTEYLGGERVAL